jgi:hypothetical protein
MLEAFVPVYAIVSGDENSFTIKYNEETGLMLTFSDERGAQRFLNGKKHHSFHGTRVMKAKLVFEFKEPGDV